MQVITTQPIRGVESDTEITVTKADGEWLLQQGYARVADASDPDHGLLATSAPAKNDPTLAQNREHPDAEKPDGTANPDAKQANALPAEETK